jgi:hypothetical protein
MAGVFTMGEGVKAFQWLREDKKFWEELIAYFPLIRHGSHTKRRL